MTNAFIDQNGMIDPKVLQASYDSILKDGIKILERAQFALPIGKPFDKNMREIINNVADLDEFEKITDLVKQKMSLNDMAKTLDISPELLQKKLQVLEDFSVSLRELEKTTGDLRFIGWAHETMKMFKNKGIVDKWGEIRPEFLDQAASAPGMNREKIDDIMERKKRLDQYAKEHSIPKLIGEIQKSNATTKPAELNDEHEHSEKPTGSQASRFESKHNFIPGEGGLLPGLFADAGAVPNKNIDLVIAPATPKPFA